MLLVLLIWLLSSGEPKTASYPMIFDDDGYLYVIQNQDTLRLWSGGSGRMSNNFFLMKLEAPIVILDFEQMLLINTHNIEDHEQKKYKSLKASVSTKKILIDCSSNFKSVRVAFDVGHPGNFIFRSGKHLSPAARSTLNDVQFLYDHQPVLGKQSIRPGIWFLGAGYNTTVVVAEKPPSVGTGFIKGFNWVIDLKRRTVAARKNSVPIDQTDRTVKIP